MSMLVLMKYIDGFFFLNHTEGFKGFPARFSNNEKEDGGAGIARGSK